MNPFSETFEDWLARFVAFKIEVAATLGQPVPDESQLLKFEGQQLEPMLFKAEEFAADAAHYYYERKSVEMKKLNLGEWPRSGLEAPAKAASHRQLWARESARGIVRVIVSRGFRISAALKQLGEK